MKRVFIGSLAVAACAVMSSCALNNNQPVTPHEGPEAAGRSYAQNYKDMALATCVADAYNRYASTDNTTCDAACDAGSSISLLREWGYYDLDEAPDAIKALVDSYLGRDYFNPLAEVEVKGVRFDFLKCLDMYHSKELDEQVKRWVLHPNRTSRQDFLGSPRDKSKSE